MKATQPIDLLDKIVLAVVWAASPIAILFVWELYQFMSFYQGLIEDGLRRFDGNVSLPDYLLEWWRGGRWVVLFEAFALIFVVSLYGWAALTSWRLICLGKKKHAIVS